MKKGLFFLVMLVSVVAWGFAQSILSGTYRYSEDSYINFTGALFTGAWDTDTTMSGTYLVSRDKLTLYISGGTLAGNVWNWRIMNENIIRDHDGDRWNKVAGKGTSSGDRSAREAPKNTSSSNLIIWSFTDELGGIIENYYKRAHPDVKIDYSMTPTERFPSKLDTVLASDRGAPDIFALESSFVRKYVESGLLLDLTDIYESNKSKLLAYPAEIGTHNGKVYAMSWQACPGAMFYRRSLAKKYLGTDDPKVVQTYFSSLNKFLETSQLLNEKSNGNCVVVPSLSDLFYPFLGLRRDPWVVNGKLCIDPVMEQYMDLCKTLHDNRWEGGVGQWSEGWFVGMKDELRDEKSRRLEVFSYFFPTWGLHYVLKTNTYDTSGDWAMIQGPAPYRWGGTWIGAYKGTRNVEAVKEFIRYVTTDDVFLEQYAKDSGDMVTNLTAINKIKDMFYEPFLGGQNHYAEFARLALEVNGKLVQSHDDVIQSFFSEAVQSYVHGEKTKARALADFRRMVESQLGL
jgi:ABC-type glycerol-3-phosphate transport system substrate-binding protein